jgi:hypothetical protein
MAETFVVIMVGIVLMVGIVDNMVGIVLYAAAQHHGVSAAGHYGNAAPAAGFKGCKCQLRSVSRGTQCSAVQCSAVQCSAVPSLGITEHTPGSAASRVFQPAPPSTLQGRAGGTFHPALGFLYSFVGEVLCLSRRSGNVCLKKKTPGLSHTWRHTI